MIESSWTTCTGFTSIAENEFSVNRHLSKLCNLLTINSTTGWLCSPFLSPEGTLSHPLPQTRWPYRLPRQGDYSPPWKDQAWRTSGKISRKDDPVASDPARAGLQWSERLGQGVAVGIPPTHLAFCNNFDKKPPSLFNFSSISSWCYRYFSVGATVLKVLASISKNVNFVKALLHKG